MTTRFKSRWITDFEAFLRFKRSLGYRYARGEFTLREFDRFLLRSQAYPRRAEGLDQAMLAWLASKPHRKAISVSADASVLRQFCLYLRRCPGRTAIPEPHWPRLPRESTFVPYILTRGDIRRLLQLAAQLTRPAFRAVLYWALLLLLYCTGLRFGEALRLRMRDVDTRAGVLQAFGLGRLDGFDFSRHSSKWTLWLCPLGGQIGDSGARGGARFRH